MAAAKRKTSALDALTFLAKPDAFEVGPVCVAFGDDSFLKRQVLLHWRSEVLTDEEAQFSLQTFEGSETDWAEVRAELATYSMFGDDRRLVVIETADDFVSRYRSELENYLESPSATGVLVLLLKSFPANTRLYQRASASGRVVDCKTPSADRMVSWAATWAKQTHRVGLDLDAAEALVEMIGNESGLIDQELAKLAASIKGPDQTDEKAERRIDLGTVLEMGGSWRAKTTWDMLDAALAGQVREALVQLDRLLLAGEMPIGVLGQISASLRRFAATTRIVLQTEAAGRRPVLGQALEEAGIRRFVLAKSQNQLRHLGRYRGEQLYRWLLETDLALKGASALPPRLVLENLLLRIASPELRNPSSKK